MCTHTWRSFCIEEATWRRKEEEYEESEMDGNLEKIDEMLGES